jgi:membrane-anchored protein YejM (alkaline phosphatase superfamily)
MVQDQPAALRVPDPSIRQLFTREARWQAWLDVEVALAKSEAEIGMIPAAAAAEIARKAHLELFDLDRVVEELFDLVPENTYITITSDHGELFGEDGFFGHGPIQHDKVFEVPFVEGKLR